MTIEQKIPVGATGENLRSFEQTTTAGVVQVEAVAAVDPTDIAAIQRVRNADPVANDYGAVVRLPIGSSVIGLPALVASKFDTIAITYNVDNSINVATYKLGGVTQATITCGYTSGNLTSVVRT